MEPKQFTLKNGLRVVFVDTQTFPTITTLLLIGAGSRYENKVNNGIAHFFEHMPYKGSAKYPNSFVISSTIEGLGGIFNAFTAKDHTGYWVKATSEHFSTVIDILADVLLHPLLVPEEIEREKGVIVEEINMYEDTPAERVGELFEQLLYKNNPLGYDILGTKETVTSFTRDTFTSYMSRFYHPKNVVLVVAGGLKYNGFKKDEDYAGYVSLIEEKFGAWNGESAAEYKPVQELQTEPQFILKSKKTEQAHFCLGYRTFSFFDNRKYVLSVLSAILGGGMSSRLFNEVREKRGLCYYISTGRQLYHDVGNMVTQAGVVNNIEKVHESVKVTLAEHKKLAEGEATAEELKNAKELIKGRLLLSLEKSENVASFFGNELILRNEVDSVQNVIEEVEKVTLEQVTALAKDTFKPEKLNFSLIGPFEKKEITPFLKDFNG